MSKLIIHSDGASKGNPGDAGIGVVVSAEDGAVLREVAEYIGETTNNAAEYAALIRGLREAAQLGATMVEISTDSELLARQLTGVYKVKSETLKPLHHEAVSLMRCFASAGVTHVPRELNKRADQLANKAIEKHRKKRGDSKTPAKKQPSQRELGLS